MNKNQFEKTIAAIDEANSEDPNKETKDGKELPKELLYSQRMTEVLKEYFPDSSELLQIAARGQHIKRWSIPRTDFEMDRNGYLKWRSQLKLVHAKLLEGIMNANGYTDDQTKQVKNLVLKKQLKINREAQTLEDIVCLVFLKYYFKGFSEKHTEEKLITIIQKTWGKMSEEGHKYALMLSFEPHQLALIQKALA